jgi:cellulose synthase/poly-beta-1,6-N-acetylglucosamine synthase-like glycosyltransferase
VTRQICAYNEGIVVLETIELVCSLDWPVDNLHIQICDDSTEKESKVTLEDAVAQWRVNGMDVTRLERPELVIRQAIFIATSTYTATSLPTS